MSGCGNYCGSCGSCGDMILSPGEIKILNALCQIPFLPVARRADSMEPMYFEDSDYPAGEYSLILQCLEKRGLISIDYDLPLKGTYSDAYLPYPVRGSFALTAKGQEVTEIIALQGITEVE